MDVGIQTIFASAGWDDITDAQVSGAPHANFPVLIARTEAWLRTTTSGGRIANANASDLWFSLDAAGTLSLPHEIERYDPTNGTLFTWVKITSLEPTTTFFVHYGDPARTTVRLVTLGRTSRRERLVIRLELASLASRPGRLMQITWSASRMTTTPYSRVDFRKWRMRAVIFFRN